MTDRSRQIPPPPERGARRNTREDQIRETPGLFSVREQEGVLGRGQAQGPQPFREGLYRQQSSGHGAYDASSQFSREANWGNLDHVQMYGQTVSPESYLFNQIQSSALAAETFPAAPPSGAGFSSAAVRSREGFTRVGGWSSYGDASSTQYGDQSSLAPPDSYVSGSRETASSQGDRSSAHHTAATEGTDAFPTDLILARHPEKVLSLRYADRSTGLLQTQDRQEVAKWLEDYYTHLHQKTAELALQAFRRDDPNGWEALRKQTEDDLRHFGQMVQVASADFDAYERAYRIEVQNKTTELTQRTASLENMQTRYEKQQHERFTTVQTYLDMHQAALGTWLRNELANGQDQIELLGMLKRQIPHGHPLGERVKRAESLHKEHEQEVAAQTSAWEQCQAELTALTKHDTELKTSQDRIFTWQGAYENFTSTLPRDIHHDSIHLTRGYERSPEETVEACDARIKQETGLSRISIRRIARRAGLFPDEIYAAAVGVVHRQQHQENLSESKIVTALLGTFPAQIRTQYNTHSEAQERVQDRHRNEQRVREATGMSLRSLETLGKKYGYKLREAEVIAKEIYDDLKRSQDSIVLGTPKRVSGRLKKLVERKMREERGV